jgi:hypothetical protein
LHRFASRGIWRYSQFTLFAQLAGIAPFSLVAGLTRFALTARAQVAQFALPGSGELDGLGILGLMCSYPMQGQGARHGYI